jgi:GAF domain-containing protein
LLVSSILFVRAQDTPWRPCGKPGRIPYISRTGAIYRWIVNARQQVHMAATMIGPASTEPKPELYRQLALSLAGLLGPETDMIANAANTASLLYTSLPQINWAGFYFWRADELVLGPFQGNPACTRIKRGAGVCGAAAQRRQTILLPDVHEFPGHIACDVASRSELVVPLIGTDDRLLGVLDIDSPVLDRFDADDQAGIERVAGIFVEVSEVSSYFFEKK